MIIRQQVQEKILNFYTNSRQEKHLTPNQMLF